MPCEGLMCMKKGKRLRKMYLYYTTCPKCAKKYGKNYIVILAEIDAGRAG